MKFNWCTIKQQPQFILLTHVIIADEYLYNFILGEYN